MQIVPIKNILIFDIAKSGGRDQRTYFSLEIDGFNVYSKSVHGFPTLNSGGNTIGAFQNEQRDSLFAWIDPLSGEFFVTTDEGTFKPLMAMPGVIFVLVALIIKFTGVWPDAPLQMFVIPVLLGALVGAVLKKVADHKLESILRSRLKNGG